MRRSLFGFLAICLFSQPGILILAQAPIAKETVQQTQTADARLRNDDVLEMQKAANSADTIVARIKTSKTAFDISPAKLQELKDATVPDAVIVAMLEAVQHQQSSTVLTAPVRRELQIPDGTRIEIESAYDISSLHFKAGQEVSFRVVDPVLVDGVTLIERGATATGRIERSKRGGHWGKAGLLTWSMKSVTSADGAQIPLRVEPMRLRGDSKGAKVATEIAVTGALLFWIAPVALLHGFKRGGDAFIPAGRRFEVYVDGAAPVKGRVQ